MTTFNFSARAVSMPYHCAAFPQLGAEHARGYVRLGTNASGGGRESDIWLSIEAMHAIAREVPQAGLALADEVAVLKAENDQLRASVADLEDALAEAEKELEHISFLKGRGYQDVKRTGRPKKDETSTQKAA